MPQFPAALVRFTLVAMLAIAPATLSQPSATLTDPVAMAIATELEMVSYGERPPLLHELRAGLEQAAMESGPSTEESRWFLARRDALPGTDLPEDPGYLPI